jgi:hypothetical protein
MAVVLIEGFDMYNGLGANTGLVSKWTAPGGSGQSMVAGRFGGQAWRLQPAIAQAIERTLPAAGTTFAVGAAIRLTSLFPGTPSAKSHLCLNKFGTGLQCGILFDASGSISAWRLSGDVSGTLLGTSATGLMAPNVWYYVEVEFVISTTVGRITVYLNGTQILNVTGANTANNGVGTNADTLHLASTNGGNGNAGFVDYDDMYVVDVATKLGERRVETLRPTADTATKQWTPDTGTVDFSRVNATLAQSTTFVQASTVGNLDLYDIADLSSTPAAIDAVQYNIFAQKTDATTRDIAAVGDISGTQQQTADFPLGVGVGKLQQLFLLNPSGGAWSASDVNALRIGPKVTV